MLEEMKCTLQELENSIHNCYIVGNADDAKIVEELRMKIAMLEKAE